MDIILAVAVLVFAGVNVFFILSANRVEKQNCMYETAFCRDVRAKLEMFVYPSQVEAKRKRLNNKKSKF